ncbi:putative 3-oxoadipate enol-lactonase [Nitrospira sp. KM1]|uniref:alpha/beta fold hydrolase n=1 Tax=Nitrospira sp. KM1 TaxID=1936990 RepID=UPI0013A78F00|nr:alpha/beta fold hydrolase [Nitrospira sp. KM1]BCA54664.1 putative 3-oxoadipate enol-lactonase [Nitrospira sp. KM1]
MKAQINGITLGYSDQGKGTPLVFLHAFPFNRTMWAAQEEDLSDAFRIITVDMRGHGESEAPFWRYSLEQYASDVTALLRHLRIDNAVFIGLSMGGYLSFTLYRLYPEFVLGFVLADTRAEADNPEQGKWRFELARRAAAQGPSAVVADMLPKLLSHQAYERRPDLVEQVKSIQEAATVPGILGDLRAMAERPDSTDMLRSIRVPTLVLVGEEDVLTPRADAERITAGIPEAILETIPDAGHMSNMERPETFNKAVRRFAAGIDRR